MTFWSLLPPTVGDLSYLELTANINISHQHHMIIMDQTLLFQHFLLSPEQIMMLVLTTGARWTVSWQTVVISKYPVSRKPINLTKTWQLDKQIWKKKYCLNIPILVFLTQLQDCLIIVLMRELIMLILWHSSLSLRDVIKRTLMVDNIN